MRVSSGPRHDPARRDTGERVHLVAGLVMKLVGGAILWVVIAAIFFRWGHEETTEGWDALKFRNVEREIRAGMGR